MTDVNSIIALMEQRRAALVQTGKTNKESVFDALAGLGLTHVCVDFDGEGDSGQINNIAAYAGSVLTELPERKISLHSVNWDKNDLICEGRTLPSSIEQLCCDFLEQEHGGWENNDGAYGEFTLDVPTRTIALEFNGRYSDVHTTVHTF